MPDKYRIQNDCLIIIGSKKSIALFENSPSHKKYIKGETGGSYSRLNPKLLLDHTSPLILDYLPKRNNELITEFEEKMESNPVVYGIQNNWKLALEGRAFKLIIENDFRRPAFLDGRNKLYLNVPKKPHIVLSDIVEY